MIYSNFTQSPFLTWQSRHVQSGSPNHTYSLCYSFLVYFSVLQLAQSKRRYHTYTQLSSASTALIRYRPPAVISIQILLHTTPLIYQQSVDSRCQINSQCMATNRPQQKPANLIIILNDRLQYNIIAAINLLCWYLYSGKQINHYIVHSNRIVYVRLYGHD